MTLQPEEIEKIEQQLSQKHQMPLYMLGHGIFIQAGYDYALSKPAATNDEGMAEMSDNEIVRFLGMIKDGEVVEEKRDTFLLSEAEQDKAIILHLEILSQRGEFPLSDETKKYATYDALCGAELTKAFRSIVSFLSPIISAKEKEAVRKYKKALESMVWQFAYRRGGTYLSTAGLSALEEAFEVLGWKDPYFVKDLDVQCDVKGCHEFHSPQITWDGVYVLICDKHFKDYLAQKPLPQLKKSAIKREASRDPVTRCLPEALKEKGE